MLAWITQLFRPARDLYRDQITENLLRGVWGFGSPQTVPKAKAASCFYHYENLLTNRQLLDDQNTSLRESDSQSADVIALIARLKPHSQTSIESIRESLRDDPPSWLRNTSDDVLDKVLLFALRLWLFTKPDLSDGTVTLQRAVEKPLSSMTGSSNTWLWLDFSEQTLIKRGRFRLDWTSDISEHLTFASKFVIRVFIHSSVLELYENSAEGAIYPKGLLKEIRKTFNLLWPIEDPIIAKRVYRLETEEEIDIETGMGHHEKFDLRAYPVFGERLAKIQDRLEAEEFRQSSSRGIQIAIWGIVLTAVFGLVSAITGVMQVWASFQTLSR